MTYVEWPYTVNTKFFKAFTPFKSEITAFNTEDAERDS